MVTLSFLFTIRKTWKLKDILQVGSRRPEYLWELYFHLGATRRGLLAMNLPVTHYCFLNWSFPNTTLSILQLVPPKHIQIFLTGLSPIELGGPVAISYSNLLNWSSPNRACEKIKAIVKSYRGKTSAKH